MMKKRDVMIVSASLGGALVAHAAQLVDYDAGVLSSILTDATSVTQWVNQADSAYNGTTVQGAVTYPASYQFVTGAEGLDFSSGANSMQVMTAAESDALLDFTGAAAENSGLSVIIAFRDDGTTGSGTWTDLFGNTSTATGFLMRYSESSGDLVFGMNGLTVVQSALNIQGASVVYGLNFSTNGSFTATYITSFGESNTVTGTKTLGDFSTAVDLRMGEINNNTRYFDGLIGEVRVYDSVLADADFQAQIAEMYSTWADPSAASGILPPDAVTATAGDELVTLDWNDSAQPDLFKEFEVYRAETTLGYTNQPALVTGLTNSAYVDTNSIVAGTTYYYAVKQIDTNDNASVFSSEVSATPFTVDTNTYYLINYDGSLPGSVSADGSGLVSAWINQVTPGTYDAIDSGTVPAVYPSANLSATGGEGVDFTTNRAELALMSSLESDDVLKVNDGSSGFVVMMAFRPETSPGQTVPYQQDDIIGNSTAVNSGFGIRWLGTDNYGFQTWLGSGGGNATPSTAQNGDTIVVSFKYDVTDGEYTFWESASGNSTTVSRDPADFSTGAALTLGETTGADDSRSFAGTVYEVKIWGSTLDDAALEDARNAMILKWIGSGAGYNAWASQFGEIGSETNDADGDGVLNLYEYGLAGDPTNTTVEPAVLPKIINTGSGLEYVYIQRNDDAGLIYSVETTTDLINGPWTNTGVTATSTNAYATSFDVVTNDVESVADKRFIRLIIEN